jgi:predicted ATPase/DNA-binding SARP family transcriptional activator
MNVELPLPRLKVVALGPLTVIYDKVNITGQLSRTTQLLLIYLLTTAKPHAREMLAELFWPERSTKQAASNLRTILTELRKACTDAVVITREDVAVDLDCAEYDVAAFRLHIAAPREARTPVALKTAVTHWEAAMHLYQRPFLAGLREPPSAELQLWLTLERELLYHQMLSTLRQLVSYYANIGERASALAWAKRWLALEPVDEDALQQVMRLSAQQGEPETALTYYRAYLRAQQQASTTMEVTPALATLVHEIMQGVYVPVAPLPLPTTNHDAGAKPDLSGALLQPSARPTNLPGTLAPLIGRSQEIDQVCTLLLTQKQRLVTIVGLGGQGKTRLAVAVAAACQAAYPDGIWFIALDGITGQDAAQTQADSPARLREQVANAIGSALGQSLAGAQSVAEQVMRQLQDKALCLVLDNFEPLMAVAPFLLQLLEGAPRLTLLVTSRVRLNLLAECVYLLGGLALPAATTATAVAQSAAGQLFLASARRHLPDFAIDEIAAPTIAKLCQLTAGMPLALILASTWVEHLSIGEIVAELEANLALLAADAPHLPLRQQNVAQIIEVSWHALSPSEQLALAQLSVFSEPFSRQAAQAVADVTLAQLRTLTDKALLTVAGPGVYHFHPLIHHFVRQKLAATPDVTQVRQRHAHYFQQLVQTMTTLPATTDRQQEGRQQEGQQHWPGYRDVCAALEWLLTHRPATGIAFLFDLYPLWEHYGYLGDGRHWLQVGLRYMPAAELPRAHLLRLAGSLAEKQRDLAVAKQLLSEALQLYEALQHAEGQAATLGVLGWVTFHERLHYTAVQPALDYFERSLQIYRTLGNRAQIANQLGNISQLLIMEKQRPAAQIRVDLEEALAIYQGSIWIARIKGTGIFKEEVQ